MAIGGLGEGHQHAGSPADGEFAEASGTGSANGQVGMLKQAGDVIAEASFGQVGVTQLVDLRVIPSGEVNHSAPLIQEGGQDRSHHPVEPNSALTSSHHH